MRPPKKTEKPVQTEEEKLSELLESHVYNGEQLGEIMLAIGAGISYDKILQMADIKNSAEKIEGNPVKNFTKETASDLKKADFWKTCSFLHYAGQVFKNLSFCVMRYQSHEKE